MHPTRRSKRAWTASTGVSSQVPNMNSATKSSSSVNSSNGVPERKAIACEYNGSACNFRICLKVLRHARQRSKARRARSIGWWAIPHKRYGGSMRGSTFTEMEYRSVPRPHSNCPSSSFLSASEMEGPHFSKNCDAQTMQSRLNISRKSPLTTSGSLIPFRRQLFQRARSKGGMPCLFRASK